MTLKKKATSKTKQCKTPVYMQFQLHLGALKRFVSGLLGDQGDVEDVVQEVFLRAYNAEKQKDISQPKSYLFRVARNVAVDQMRQKVRRPTDYLEDFEPSRVLIDEWTLEDELIAQQKLEVHCAAVATLPPKCRKIYLMRKVYGWSIKEIADILGLSASTVETQLTKGFARCDAYVEKHLGNSDASPLTKKRSG